MFDFMQTPGFGVLLSDLLMVWPLRCIFQRAGLSSWWSLVVLVPVVGLLAVVVVLSLTRWPTLPARRPKLRKARRVVP